MDPFATLGIPRSFDVELPVVERIHRELSRAVHPDRYVGAGASERRAALAKAVEVNEAWRIVRDPIRRAEALLTLSGVEVAEGTEPKADPEFLMEMLEQREALGEARRARDLANVKRMASEVEERSRRVERALSSGFATGITAPLAGKLAELRFYRRFLDEVSASLDELGDEPRDEPAA